MLPELDGRGNLVRLWLGHIQFRSRDTDVTSHTEKNMVILLLRSAFIYRSSTVCQFRAWAIKILMFGVYEKFLFCTFYLKGKKKKSLKSNAVRHFVKLTENALTLTRGSPSAARLDLRSAYDTTVPAKRNGLIKTGLPIQLPDGCYGRIAPPFWTSTGTSWA